MDYSLDSIYEGLYEYYINDYIIFEGVLRRDYYEVTGILNENTVTNFFKSIWEKILTALKWLRDKIKELINKLFKRNKEEDSDSEEETVVIKDKKMTVKEMIKKFKSLTNEDDNKKKLENLKVSGFRYNSNSQVHNIHKEINYYNDIIFNISNGHLEEYLKNEKEIGFCMKINETDCGKELKRTKELIYDSMFVHNDIEYPFKNIDYYKIGAKIEKSNIDTLKDILTSYKKRIDEVINKVEGRIKIFENKLKKKDSEFILTQQKNATIVLRAINISSRMICGIYAAKISCQKMARKQCIKLYKTAINYLENNSSSNKEDSQNASYIDYDMDYINALSEATIYEL